MGNHRIKTAFFGTHNFAAIILRGLINHGLFDIKLVTTQPDRPTGRKQELQKGPVKILSEQFKLPVYQPEKLRASGLLNLKFEAENQQFPQLGIVAQYGLIISQPVIDLFLYGILNVHASLLPYYRGASPIQTALMNGETETGVTIMKLDAGMDTGPILAQKHIKIDPDDTCVTLSAKLAEIGSLALLEVVPAYISGALKPMPQDNSDASYARQLTREDGIVNWQRPAQEIYNQWRGLMPWPGIWTMIGGKRVKLLQIRPTETEIKKGRWKEKNGKLFVGCGDKAIEILEIQLEGGRPMNALAFVNGNKKLLFMT